MNKQPVIGIVSFKEQNGLTWPQVASLFGVTVSACHHWRSGLRSMPGSCLTLIRLFTDHPAILFNELERQKTVLAES